MNRDYSYAKLTGLCKGKPCWRITFYLQKCRNLNSNLLLTKCQLKDTFWPRLITFKTSDDDISLSCLSQLRDSNVQAFIYYEVFICRISQSRRELFGVSQVTICFILSFFSCHAISVYWFTGLFEVNLNITLTFLARDLSLLGLKQ